MITKDNLKALLLSLNFEKSGNQYSKEFTDSEAYLKVDFDKNLLIYPEDQGLKIHERQTCNFSANENFVVFECVHRLLEKGYKPEHIELEPKWKLGHGASGGRADILIKDNQGHPLLIIECKTQAIELAAEIDQNQQIHLQLPKTINAHKAKVIVMYEETVQPLKPITLGLFKGKIQLSNDFNDPLPDSFWLSGQL